MAMLPTGAKSYQCGEVPKSQRVVGTVVNSQLPKAYKPNAVISQLQTGLKFESNEQGVIRHLVASEYVQLHPPYNVTNVDTESEFPR